MTAFQRRPECVCDDPRDGLAARLFVSARHRALTAAMLLLYSMLGPWGFFRRIPGTALDGLTEAEAAPNGGRSFLARREVKSGRTFGGLAIVRGGSTAEAQRLPGETVVHRLRGTGSR